MVTPYPDLNFPLSDRRANAKIRSIRLRPIAEGTTHTDTVFPEPIHLASSLGNHGVDVVSTPSLILFFEAASNNLAAPYYERDEISVGTHVNVDHLGPVKGDAPIKITAKLTLHKGRRLEFDLVAEQGQTLVMRGQHFRAVLKRDRFSETKSTREESKPIEFWFDFHSPWCYFASHQIGEVAREFNLKLSWRPVHLANLIKATNGRRPLEANDNFVKWYKQDIQDTATLLGLPLDQHKDYPCKPSRALRAAIYAEEQGLAAPFVMQVMRGYWSEQKDIGDLNWISEVASSVGLDANLVKKAALDQGYKKKFAENLELAVNNRFFGLPVAFYDQKIFWGNDRLPLLRSYLSANLG